jgi:predicted nucleic-acid-binding protein
VSIIVDTNVILRLVTGDTPEQYELSRQILEKSESIFIPVLVVAEMIWVLKRIYKNSRNELVSVVELILSMEKVVIDRPAVAAGIAMLKAGGDFADGVIAFDGARLGGGTFVSFDKKACHLLEQQGTKTLALAAE